MKNKKKHFFSEMHSFTEGNLLQGKNVHIDAILRLKSNDY